MSNVDKVMEMYFDLKKELLQTGLEINNDKGATNLIILSLSKAFGRGFEQGETSGRMKAMDNFMEVFNQINN